MKLFKRVRGPRLSTKLILLGLLLLIVPTWLSYRQLLDMERILIQAQSQTQLKTAQGIATLFNGHDDLFNDLPVSFEDYEALYARPLPSAIRIDGSGADWGDALNDIQSFGPVDQSTTDGRFQLALGERGGQLYAFMEIDDDKRIYRDPEVLSLDKADQIRLSFIKADGEDGRITINFVGPGVTTAYEMDPEWKFALTGSPENRVQGEIVEAERGFQLEFRMPLELLGSRRYFGLSFVDVDDPDTRDIRAITQTLPTTGKESFNLVVLRSPEVLKIIQGLGYSGARILVVDSQNRVRAQTGSESLRESSPQPSNWIAYGREGFQQIQSWTQHLFPRSADTALKEYDQQTLMDDVIKSSLAGEPIALRRRLRGEEEIIVAAHPIVSKDSILGTVVVEQNINDILTFQRAALEQIIVLSMLSLLTVLIGLLAFSGRLAWRIRALRKETSTSIDQYGRLKTSSLKSGKNAADEIGDLSRSVSAMLSKLQQHTQFLENMPRTLRHEINNPLNTLSTSLQNLAQENAEIRDSKYLDSAKRGVTRIGIIVQNLADAANLEESLESEELEIVDIQQLIENYVANCRITHKDCKFVYRGLGTPVLARVSDFRIEQLLDKIIDNAIDFHRSNSPIKIQLDTFRDFLQITVANRGPLLPEDSQDSLFDSMVSHRGSSAQNRLHFGLGLYVVRIIAEHHGGSVRAMNLADGSGVAVMVQLPLASPVQQQAIHANDAMRMSAG